MAKNAKTQKRKNAKTQKRKNANQNVKRKKNKTNGGFNVENKGTYNVYTFDKDEIKKAKAEDERLTQIWKDKEPKNDKDPEYKRVHYEWYESKPNLNDIIKIFDIPVEDKSYATSNLRPQMFKWDGA